METVGAVVEKKRITGGGFLIEDLTPNDVFTPEDLSLEQRQIVGDDG